MLNLKELENLRTKEELIDYFKLKGINITDEEIDALKMQYEEIKHDESVLTQNQLDQVAGGLAFLHIANEHLNPKHKKAILDTYNSDKNPIILGVIDLGEKGVMMAIYDGKNQVSYLKPTEVKITNVKDDEQANVKINGMEVKTETVQPIFAPATVIHQKLADADDDKENNLWIRLGEQEGINFNQFMQDLKQQLEDKHVELDKISGFKNFHVAVQREHANIEIPIPSSEEKGEDGN